MESGGGGCSERGLRCLSQLLAGVSELLAVKSFLRSFPPSGSAEGLRQQQPDTEAVLNGKGLSTGTLYIAESRLSCLDGSGLGFSLEYPTISLHAVSRDLNAYPREHLYVMVNAKFGEESKESVADEEKEDSDDDIEPIAEFRFVPSDKSALEAMFTTVCECQALHPDPEDEDSDDYDGDKYDVEAHEQGQGDIPTFYTYEEGLSHLTAEGQATLERLEGMLSQSVSSQYNMAGVRTEDSIRYYEDGMEVDTTPTVAGQFEDADVDH
ncbi:methylosome subunit pICln-like [Cervus elaphus]|uniref:methylosome subunit pICln-like n=1 Tax=Cervus elaphus TaxID=9860 RepID=UPI001CC273E4|nr:methylosome subunit pICln-like [Cervus elaphus]